jgi:Flp pilus assembly protein TadG
MGSDRPPVGSARRRRGDRSRGQTLVEFALLFPIFWTLLLGLIDFAFAFNGVLAVDHASRSAALIAAEAGNASGGDCVILRDIERQLTAPADAARIQRVEIYQTSASGTVIGSATVYTRTGTKSCSFADGTTITVPYTRSANGYPEASRCNVLAGCGTGHTTLDHIGVRILYTHGYLTPLHLFIGSGSSFTIDRSNSMRMEPVL